MKSCQGFERAGGMVLGSSDGGGGGGSGCEDVSESRGVSFWADIAIEEVEGVDMEEDEGDEELLLNGFESPQAML